MCLQIRAKRNRSVWDRLIGKKQKCERGQQCEDTRRNFLRSSDPLERLKHKMAKKNFADVIYGWSLWEITRVAQVKNLYVISNKTAIFGRMHAGRPDATPRCPHEILSRLEVEGRNGLMSFTQWQSHALISSPFAVLVVGQLANLAILWTKISIYK